MTIFMIGYDLNKSGKNYDGLIAEIKKISSRCRHHLGSTWLVVTPLPAAEIRDRLKAHLDSNDELMVAQVLAPAAWRKFSEVSSTWLRKHLQPLS